jgi:hypothetical protein
MVPFAVLAFSPSWWFRLASLVYASDAFPTLLQDLPWWSPSSWFLLMVFNAMMDFTFLHFFRFLGFRFHPFVAWYALTCFCV